MLNYERQILSLLCLTISPLPHTFNLMVSPGREVQINITKIKLAYQKLFVHKVELLFHGTSSD